MVKLMKFILLILLLLDVYKLTDSDDEVNPICKI